ncbi:hypothetical protein AAFF_G00367590 [Aldrovandia affinis]|uniref:Uncharacterized protein n=1 Tax=Aldrovandia affinis TaxID=143900 RepID=A0AAD7VZN4_9TELE|nr:hypothetical protein AAFF_G00367590 [Aldrovandia affinis]
MVQKLLRLDWGRPLGSQPFPRSLTLLLIPPRARWWDLNTIDIVLWLQDIASRQTDVVEGRTGGDPRQGRRKSTDNPVYAQVNRDHTSPSSLTWVTTCAAPPQRLRLPAGVSWSQRTMSMVFRSTTPCPGRNEQQGQGAREAGCPAACPSPA